MPQRLRTFIAVKISSTPGLRRVISKLEEFGRPVRTVSAEKLHVTLKFLGDTDAEAIPEITDDLQQVVAAKFAFELTIEGLGAFPHVRRPSVIWTGLKNVETLVEIAQQVDERLERRGFEREKRKFQPHLTLARIKRKPPDQLVTMVEQHETSEFGKARIGSVELLQSELKPDGPRYTVLSTAKLSPYV